MKFLSLMTSTEDKVFKDLNNLSLDFISTIYQLKTEKVTNPILVRQICQQYNVSYLYYIGKQKSFDDLIKIFGKDNLIQDINGDIILWLFINNQKLVLEILNSDIGHNLKIWSKNTVRNFLENVKLDTLKSLTSYHNTITKYLEGNINNEVTEIIKYLNNISSRYCNPNKSRLRNAINKIYFLSMKLEKKNKVCSTCFEEETIPVILKCGHQICLDCFLKFITQWKAPIKLECSKCNTRVEHATVLVD